jgi:small subunit ribosomal protein S36
VPGLAALVVAFVIGGWWWVVNVLRYHKVQPGVPGFPLGKFLDHRYGEFLGYLIKAMPLRWWSSLGWYEVNLPWKFINTATFVVIALSIYAVVRARSRLRISLALLLWPLLGTYLLVIAQGVRHFLSTHYVAGLSGRYLFDGVAGLAVVVGVGASLLPRKLARWTPLVLLIGAAVMQAKTVQLAVRRWWQPSGRGLRQAWGALSSWSPWPPEVLQAVVAIGAVLVVIAVVTLVRAGRSTPETPAVRQAV